MCDKSREKINKLIEKDIKTNKCFSNDDKYVSRHVSIVDAALHSIKGGKRLRSLIASSIGSYSDAAIEYALFIEYVHTASLIIDDLPCMDNDSERRSLPTVHAKYGEHTAQLLSHNFMVVAIYHLMKGTDMAMEQYDETEQRYLRDFVNKEVSSQLSFAGLCGGQIADMLLDKKGILMSSRDTLTSIINMMETKTGCLFRMCFSLGWIARGGNVHEVQELGSLGNDFGICYQIIDDLRDIEKDSKRNNCVNNICKYCTRNKLIDIFHDRFVSLYSGCVLYDLMRDPVIAYLVDYLKSSFIKEMQ